VALRRSTDELARLNSPPLGDAVVEQRAFVGSFERLRLRLPPQPGVRPIAPPVPFGSDEIVVEATRPQTEARGYPLQAGDPTWVGVRRVHALAHPGLSLLLLADGTAPSRAAVALAGQLARLAHARVTVLAHRRHHPPARPETIAAAARAAAGRGRDSWRGAGGAAPGRGAGGLAPGRGEDRLAPGRGGRDEGGAAPGLEALLQEVRETLGSGLAALETRAVAGPPDVTVAEENARQPADLVVVGRPARHGAELAERLLQGGAHNLLLVPGDARPTVERLLICVAIGEPGKADVSFAGRLARHLGAEATILTVLPENERNRAQDGAQRFLASCSRTLTGLGVPATTRIRFGTPREQILDERREGGHDLLVVGAPLPAGAPGRFDLGGLMTRLLRESEVPVLIVRSPEAAA
jgi:sulfate transport system ATP-binding protein